MRGFHRADLLFSLCGLNCGLCPMHLDGRCPGCGGGEGNQSCAIARCSLAHGGMEYCFQCEEYPCARYDGMEEYDSFVTHRHQRQDMERMRAIGPDAYGAEQRERRRALDELLADFNDGRRKTLFCVASALLPLPELREVMGRIAEEAAPDRMPLKERAACAAQLLGEVASRCGIELKLRRKPRNRG
ncbi:MAG: DUF3795 domain-containing protein [Clostridia bacterium]|nr:DUF3795 domain-containing protein [Clostridia bacterium]